MKTFKTFVVVLFLLSLFFVGNNAYADTIQSLSNPLDVGWQNWNLSDLDNDAKPYWDNKSSDGTNKNIGYILTSGNAYPGAIHYWGRFYNAQQDTYGAADSNFYFTGSAGSHDVFALVLELAAYSPNNIFGWYATDENGARIDTINHIIFNGSDTAGVSKEISVSSPYYGFYLQVLDTGKIYYTESKNNSIGTTSEQHFSVFQDNNSFWMGMEDVSFSCGSDKDYNDMVVQITQRSVPVPESSTISLIAVGIIGLGILRRLKI